MIDGRIVFPEVPAYKSDKHKIKYFDPNGNELAPDQLAFLQKLISKAKEKAQDSAGFQKESQ